MSAPRGDLIRDLALANRVLAKQGVLDAFGHVSARNPENPARYFQSRGISPGTVREGDIVELDLDGEPVTPTDWRLYGERPLHGEIYRARPDVMAICHMHSPAIVAFAISGVEIQPVFHLGATIGPRVPFWDARAEFGDTDLRVATKEQGKSLARALGPDNWSVVLRRHGAAVGGRSIPEMVFRSVNLRDNADLQYRAHTLGKVSPLTPGEAALGREFNLRPHPVKRAWDYWVSLLEGQGEGLTPEPRV
jgi:ribulose-5-phosphate 4-epimerase/fuculose-1-phosphate aldolase